MLRQKSKRYISEPTRKSKRINKSTFHRRNRISPYNQILNSNPKQSTNKSSNCVTLNNVCRDCGKNFRSAIHLKNHFCSVSDKPLECTICRKTFRQQNNLKMHNRVHLRDMSSDKNSRNNLMKENHFNKHLFSEPPKKLSTSNLSLNTTKPSIRQKKQSSINRRILRSSCGIIKEKNNLVEHIDTLVDDQSFSCKKCKMLFKRKDHLQRHLRIHAGDKPFSCNVCSKFFSRNDHLKRHFLTHLRDKPFSCYKCMKVFKHKNHLTLHNRIHSKNNLKKKKSENAFKRKAGIKKSLDSNRQDKSFASKAMSKMPERTNRIRNTSGAYYMRDKSLSNDKCDKDSDQNHEVASLGCPYSVSNTVEVCSPEKVREEEKYPEGKVCVNLADNPFNGIEAVSPSDNLIIDATVSKNENSQDCCDGNKGYSNDIELKSNKVIEKPIYSHDGNVHDVVSSPCAFSVRDSTECCISEEIIEDGNHLGQVRVDLAHNPFNGIENLKALSPDDNIVIEANISKNESSQDCCDGNKGHPNDIEFKSNNVIENPICSYCDDIHEAVSSICTHSVREFCFPEKIREYNEYPEWQICVNLVENMFNGIENLKSALQGDIFFLDSNISKTENSQHYCDGTERHPNDTELKTKNVEYTMICSYCGERFKRHGDLQRHLRVHRITITNETSSVK